VSFDCPCEHTEETGSLIQKEGKVYLAIFSQQPEAIKGRKEDPLCTGSKVKKIFLNLLYINILDYK